LFIGQIPSAMVQATRIAHGMNLELSSQQLGLRYRGLLQKPQVRSLELQKDKAEPRTTQRRRSKSAEAQPVPKNIHKGFGRQDNAALEICAVPGVPSADIIVWILAWRGNIPKNCEPSLTLPKMTTKPSPATKAQGRCADQQMRQYVSSHPNVLCGSSYTKLDVSHGSSTRNE